jgi:hypothetical protein
MPFGSMFNFTLTSLLYSLGVAVVYGIYGYLANRPKEPFNIPLFVKTIIISIAVGLMITFSGGDATRDYLNTLAYVTANAVFMGWVDDFINSVLHLTPVPVPVPSSSTR